MQTEFITCESLPRLFGFIPRDHPPLLLQPPIPRCPWRSIRERTLFPKGSSLSSLLQRGPDAPELTYIGDFEVPHLAPSPPKPLSLGGSPKVYPSGAMGIAPLGPFTESPRTSWGKARKKVR